MTDLVQDPGRIRDLDAALGSGTLTSVALVEKCLARIAAVDGEVKAWITVSKDEALAAARALDAEAKSSGRRGPLHGVPVAVKDVIDLAGHPTRANSRSRADVAPATADATVVAHLKAAGAVILGKVHTTEYAFMQSVPPTRNPHDTTRTPGGSSAGSAAAVASGTVPLALGTQTAGSVNRPASFCGIGAFKPSTLSIAGAGVLPLAPSFDTVGAIAPTAQDAVYLAAGFAPEHLGLARRLKPVTPRIVVLEDAMIAAKSTPAVAQRMTAMAAGLEAAGLEVIVETSPVSLEETVAVHRKVMLAELGRIHGGVRRDLLAPGLAEAIATGQATSEADYVAALRRLVVLRRAFWEPFGRNDIVLLPAAPHVAPADGTTGDPSFVVPTTVFGGPVATVKAGHAHDTQMPVGGLLTMAPGADARLAGFLLSETATELDL